jgi:uncharacterized protein (DUF2235 family)
MPKRIVICCDGTWDTPDEWLPPDAAAGRRGRTLVQTNVTKLALALAPVDAQQLEQRVFYNKGVGTGRHDHWLGGTIGWGLSDHILQCYRFLVQWFEPGDELFLFGFSRGAYTARSLAGLIRNSGILRRAEAGRLDDAFALYRRRDPASHPDQVEAEIFRRSFSHETRIRFIGVWDTVGALGVPFPWLRWLNQRWQFHDVQLSSWVDFAFHAIAIDERRRWFRPTLWEQQQKPGTAKQVLEQVWFPGAHRDVGGGTRYAGLSDTALLWMKRKAEACGLAFDEARFTSLCKPNYLDKLDRPKTGYYRLVRDDVRCMGQTCRNADGSARAGATNEAAHPGAIQRTGAKLRPPYAPPNLQTFLNEGGLPAVDEKGAIA